MCSYECGERLEPFYTGGDIVLSTDGRVLVTSCDSSVKVVCVETGRVTLSLTEVSLYQSISTHTTKLTQSHCLRVLYFVVLQINECCPS